MKTKIRCNLTGIIEVFAWCKENIGSQGWAWEVTYIDDDSSYPHTTMFEFRKESDATMFTLKWLA